MKKVVKYLSIIICTFIISISDATPELEDDKVNLPAKSFPFMVRVILFPTVTVLLVTDTS